MNINSILTNPTFPKIKNLQKIIPFIVKIPVVPGYNSSEIHNIFKNKSLDTKKYLLSRKKKLSIFINKTQRIDNIKNTPLNKTSLESDEKKETFRKLIALREMFVIVADSYVKMREGIQEDVGNILTDLLNVSAWLADHSSLFYLNVLQALPDEDIYALAMNKELVNLYNEMKNEYYELKNYFELLPEPFTVKNENKMLLKKCINRAIANRKANTSYFQPFPAESELFEFLKSNHSPILDIIKNLKVIDEDQEKFIQLIKNGSQILLEFQRTKNAEYGDEDILITIEIFLSRLFFDLVYPKFSYPKTDFEELKILSQNMEKISKMTPRELDVNLKYIPKELHDKPSYLIFEQSSISKSPLNWLKASEYQISPLEAGYYISKVHESLSIYVTLQASENAQENNENKEVESYQDSKAFFNQIPGFDDIFAIWLCLLSAAQLSDPKALCKFMSDWHNLPVFPSRFYACITYLEASISQIESFGTNEANA